MRGKANAALAAGAAAATLVAAGCGGGQAEGGDFDPGIAEEFVASKVTADTQSDVALQARDLEDPLVTCTQEVSAGEEPTDEGVFTCDAEVTEVGGEVVGREQWEVAIETDPARSDSIVRRAERLSSTIGQSPEP